MTLNTPSERLRFAREKAGFGSATAFAEAHGFTESTYRSHENGTRNFRDDDAQRYAQALGVDWLWLKHGDDLGAHIQQSAKAPQPATGLSEDEEVFRMSPSDAGQHKPVVSALFPDRKNADIWQVNTSALSDAGLLPGDLMIVDLNKQAEDGDAVIAQIYDWKAGKAQTVLRIFRMPYLIGDRLTKPEQVDNDRVTIKGVVIMSWRKK